MTALQTEKHMDDIITKCKCCGIEVTEAANGFGYTFKLCDNTYQIGIDYEHEVIEILGDSGFYYIPLCLLLSFGISSEKNGYGLFFKFGKLIDFSGDISIH